MRIDDYCPNCRKNEHEKDRINAEETNLIRKYKPYYNLTDKINYRELKKVTLWLSRNQYEKLEILSKKENIKKIQLLQNIINKKIKP